MRPIILLSLIILGIGCAGTRDAAKDPNALNGVWVPVRQEMGGRSLPSAAFKDQKLVLEDSAYTSIAESVDKGIITYTRDRMDIYGKEGVNAGKHFAALYMYASDTLTVCYNLKGDSYPESFTTSGKPLFFLSVFRREATN